VVVSLALLGLAVFGIGWSAVFEKLRRADPFVYGLAFVGTLVSITLRCSALERLFRDVDGAPVGDRFYAGYLTATFLRGIVPWGRAGGPAMTAYVFSRIADSPFERNLAPLGTADFFNVVATTTMVSVGLGYLALERHLLGPVVDMTAGFSVTVVLATGLVVVSVRREEWLVRGVLGATAGLRTTVGRRSSTVRSRLEPGRVRTRLDRFFETVDAIRTDRDGLLYAFTLSHLGWLAGAVPLYLSLRAVDATVPLPVVVLVIALGGLATAVPLPGGLGGVELAITGLLVLLAGVDLPVATAGVLLYRLATYWLRIVLGGIATCYLLLDTGEWRFVRQSTG
jgi:uncharacterized protein (TIRG00374 family)